MSLATLRDDLKALEAAATGPNPVPATLRALGPVEADAADVIDLFTGSPATHATMKADPLAAECIDCCDRIKAACGTKSFAATAPAKGAPKVGAWGDGTFLKMILPIFLDWLTEWLKGN